MRKNIGYAVAFIGALLLFIGILAQVYAADRVKKAPIDTDVQTRLAGTAESGADATEFPIKVLSTTKADSEASDDDVVVYQTSSCVVRDEGDVPDCVSTEDPQERLISASTDEFATNRRTGIAVNDPDYLSASAVPHQGLVNKFPFDSEKKTYPYWNGTVGDTVDMVYDRTEEIDGLEVYVYKSSVEDFPIEITEGLNGTYSSTTEVFVEPATGAIVDQVGSQERVADNGDLVLGISAEFTDDQVEISVDDAKSNKRLLNLVTFVAPLVGYAVGIPLLIVGIVLMLLAGRRKPDDENSSPPAPASPVAAGT